MCNKLYTMLRAKSSYLGVRLQIWVFLDRNSQTLSHAYCIWHTWLPIESCVCKYTLIQIYKSPPHTTFSPNKILIIIYLHQFKKKLFCFISCLASLFGTYSEIWRRNVVTGAVISCGLRYLWGNAMHVPCNWTLLRMY